MHRAKKRTASFELSCAVCGSTASALVSGGDDKTKNLQCNLAEGSPRCGHFFCQRCQDRKFTSVEFPCPAPGCGAGVRKKTLGAESIEENDARRYREERAKVLNVRNRPRESFDDLDAFDAYLGESEDLVARLLVPDDAGRARKELEDYKREHKEEIERNETKHTTRRNEERSKLRREAEQRKEREARFKEEDREAAARPHLATSLSNLLGAGAGGAGGAGGGGMGNLAAAGHDLMLTAPKPLRLRTVAVSLSVALDARNAAIRARAGGATVEATVGRSKALAIFGFG